MAVDIHSHVFHNQYGEGEITGITENWVFVAFGEKKRSFKYPEAFDKGYLSFAIHRENERVVILDASKNISYEKIFEAINSVVGTDYTGWMRATWPQEKNTLNFRLWFPQMAKIKNGQFVSASFGCINTNSDDWSEIIFDDTKDVPDSVANHPYQGYSLTFAKGPKGGPYIFRGVYVNDKEKSGFNHDVSKRVGTIVKLIGQPSNRIEILDRQR